MIDIIQNIVQPLLTEYAVLLVLGVVGWVMRRLPARMRLDIEKRHRDALHRAIDTGIGLAFDALQKHPGVAVPDMAVTTILDYVRKSVPDAIKNLGPSQAHLEEMARAKLAKAINDAIASAKPAEDGWRAPRVPL